MKKRFERYEKLLKECDHLEKLIQKKERELSDVKALLKKMPSRKLNEIEQEVERLQERFHEKYLQSLIEAQQIENRINTLEDPKARTLMRLRYIERLEWIDVYLEVSYSKAQTHRLHKKILEELSQMKE